MPHPRLAKFHCSCGHTWEGAYAIGCPKDTEAGGPRSSPYGHRVSWSNYVEMCGSDYHTPVLVPRPKPLVSP